MKKRTALQFILPALVVVTLPYIALSAQKGSKIDSSQSINVEVGTVTEQDFPQYIESLGSLSAVKTVSISSVVDGQISKVFFSNGQSVVKDSIMIELDTRLAEASLQKAQTTYDAEKQKYDRYEKLNSEAITAISQQALDDQHVALETAQQELVIAQTQLDQLKIKSPFAGVLGEFKFIPGDYVSAGTNLVQLVDITQLLANYNIPQDSLPLLKQGQTVDIQVGAYPDKKFYGTVNYISSEISVTTREASVQALAPNPDGLLKPGMFINAKQKVGEDKNVLAVPDQSVLADLKGYYVYRVIDNKASKAYIKLGTREGGLAQVNSGLKKGDTIVTVGQQKLQDGSALTILPSSSKS